MSWKGALMSSLDTKHGDRMIYFDVLERIVFRGDVGIDTSGVVFGLG